jgi:predicted SnoaL-like aldol condensation-catalyzing enzyme
MFCAALYTTSLGLTSPQSFPVRKGEDALADDDLVALHVHLTREPNDPGLAIAELFRLKDRKIIEHWDVVQPVPEKTASGNTMF